MKKVLEGFVVRHLDIGELFKVKELIWEEQGMDDSYFIFNAPLYTTDLEGDLKKVIITIEEDTNEIPIKG